MRADRVEVSEEDHLPAGVRVLKIGEHVLDEELGAAVGVEGGGGEILGARDGGGLAVDGGGRREDDGAALGLLHGVDEDHRAGDVVAVVAHGLRDGLAHRLEAGEVNHRVNLLRGKNLVEAILVEDVAVVEREVRRLVGDELLDATKRFLAAVVEVVNHDHFAVRGEELEAGVRADVARTSGHEDGASFDGKGHAPLPGCRRAARAMCASDVPRAECPDRSGRGIRLNEESRFGADSSCGRRRMFCESSD